MTDLFDLRADLLKSSAGVLRELRKPENYDLLAKFISIEDALDLGAEYFDRLTTIVKAHDPVHTEGSHWAITWHVWRVLRGEAKDEQD